MSSRFLNCKRGSLPIKYLGLPVGASPHEGLLVGEGGYLGVRKILWVRWSDVCELKSGSGLGVRDLGIVNICLLGKWRWRLLIDGNTLVRQVLLSRYG